LGVSALDHVTIRCAQLQRSRDFYVDLLGLAQGARPAFAFRGYWLYLGGVPVVHLVEAADRPAEREIVSEGTGSFDHLAFRGDDAVALKVRLEKAGLAFRERTVPGGALAQIFVRDPEGVLVEINFRSS